MRGLAMSRMGRLGLFGLLALMLPFAASAAPARRHGAGTVAALGSGSNRTLGPDGVGTVRFGVTKLKAVTELSDLFGTPSAQGVNTGCGSRYAEVEWGDLVAEFRLSKFSGFRYITGGYPLTTPGSPRQARPKTVFPRVATSKRISLGSTLAQVRAAYRSVRPIGADTWRSPNGLVFVDNALRDPVPTSSRIREIKIGTCGDF
jgi:hypothetical protein